MWALFSAGVTKNSKKPLLLSDFLSIFPRPKVSESGVHRPHVAGIHGREHEGAYSIVLSGGYEDDVVSRLKAQTYQHKTFYSSPWIFFFFVNMKMNAFDFKSVLLSC